ncbi:MAG: hypothetical protein O9333_13680 [Beijerinckiaceae bacterium]|nr:hypothetical protein [Beijerinckiaceae bacterium]
MEEWEKKKPDINELIRQRVATEVRQEEFLKEIQILSVKYDQETDPLTRQKLNYDRGLVELKLGAEEHKHRLIKACLARAVIEDAQAPQPGIAKIEGNQVEGAFSEDEWLKKRELKRKNKISGL